MNGFATRVLATGALLLVLSACAVTPPGVSLAPRVDDRTLLGGEGFADPMGTLSVSSQDIFAISPPMQRFLDERVKGASDDRIFHELVDAMESFGIRTLSYENKTLTAVEAFEQRRGNCLAFTNMFMVMARHAGLEAQFQEVRIPPDWIRQGELQVLRRHVNVRVRITAMGMARGSKGDWVVDFDDERLPSNGLERVISDQRAMSHFYNNWAVDALEAGDAALAFRYSRASLVAGDPDFAASWGMIGTLYQRIDRSDLAEAAFLRALKAEPDDTVAMSNLQRLYERQGKAEQAEYFSRLVMRHRLKNPYFRLASAREALAAGDYRSAIDHLKKAISLKRDEADFHFLLRDVYLKNGNLKKARHYHASGTKVQAETSGVDSGARRVKPKAGT